MIVFDKQNFEQENLNSYKKTYTKKGTVFVQTTIISILIFFLIQIKVQIIIFS